MGRGCESARVGWGDGWEREVIWVSFGSFYLLIMINSNEYLLQESVETRRVQSG